PQLMMDMNKAVDIIREAIAGNKRFVVFGDYDVDGVTATVLLVQLFRKYQADVHMYIPNRFEEGYGFSSDALTEVLDLQPDLIITVDCGIRSIREVEMANQRGVNTIITDHHQPLDHLPDAAAVICPRRVGDSYPNKDLAGVGIACKLAEAVLTALPIAGESYEQWLDLVALGTVADLAPIQGENRAMVRKGLGLMRQHPRPGILSLANVSGIAVEEMSSQHIGFMLGPRLNAAGRLSSARKAYDLLMAEDMQTAGKLALELDGENQNRRNITRQIQQVVEENYDFENDQWLIMYSREEFNEGVIGLAASKLAESYYRPSVIGVEKEDVIRASCRSIPELNITSALDECMDLLIQHGGHAMAAGLTLRKENLPAFRERLERIVARELAERELIPVLDAEMEIPLAELHPSLIRHLEALEPTGVGNPAPLFISSNIEVRQLRAVGKTKDHLKLVVADAALSEKQRSRAPVLIDAIAFQFGSLESTCRVGDRIDIIYSYEINSFNGRQSIQLNIRDLQMKNR
ncbi:MAG: single-stranded-DNA-specific exonuclease RecJ, partial [Chloroflexota bacterium]